MTEAAENGMWRLVGPQHLSPTLPDARLTRRTAGGQPERAGRATRGRSARRGQPGRDWAVWARVGEPGRPALDLMHAQLVRRRFVPHMHEEFSVGVCTDGLERIDYRGSAHVSGPGSVVVVEPGEAHTGMPAASDGFTYRVFYPSPTLFAELADLPPDRPPRFGQLVFHDPELAARLIEAHAALGGGAEPLRADSQLVELLAALVRRHAVPARSASRLLAGPSGPRRDTLAREVRERLADQLTNPPTLAEIAADLRLSRYQLLRAFRAEVGMPPYAWLAQHRVARARTLLAGGGRPAEVASQVGFADQAHLTRWFRRVLGVTPGTFRNSVQDVAPG